MTKSKEQLAEEALARSRYCLLSDSTPKAYTDGYISGYEAGQPKWIKDYPVPKELMGCDVLVGRITSENKIADIRSCYVIPYDEYNDTVTVCDDMTDMDVGYYDVYCIAPTLPTEDEE